MSAELNAQPACFLKDGNDLKLKGAIIRSKNMTYPVTKSIHVKNLSDHEGHKATMADYAAEQARGAYIAVICRPNAT